MNSYHRGLRNGVLVNPKLFILEKVNLDPHTNGWSNLVKRDKNLYYLVRVVTLVVMKMNINDEMRALLILSSLPNSWDTLVVTISNSTPNNILNMESVKDSLLNEETRRKEKGKSSYEILVHEKQERQEKTRNAWDKSKYKSSWF